jgi:hypothetical protein
LPFGRSTQCSAGDGLSRPVPPLGAPFQRANLPYCRTASRRLGEGPICRRRARSEAAGDELEYLGECAAKSLVLLGQLKASPVEILPMGGGRHAGRHDRRVVERPRLDVFVSASRARPYTRYRRAGAVAELWADRPEVGEIALPSLVDERPQP